MAPARSPSTCSLCSASRSRTSCSGPRCARAAAPATTIPPMTSTRTHSLRDFISMSDRLHRGRHQAIDRLFAFVSNLVMISSGSAIESIAKPAHAHQIRGRGWILFDLPPQADDVVVDDPVGEKRAGAPRFVEQLIAAEHATPVADEGRQQLEFG